MSNWTKKEIELVIQLKSEGLNNPDIARAVNKKFNSDRTPDAVRHCYDRYYGANLDYAGTVDSLAENFKLKISKSKVVSENTTLIKDYIGKTEFLEDFKTLLKEQPIEIHKAVNVKKKSPTKRVLFMHLSDMHFHSMIESDEMGGLNRYTNIEEARRLAYFTREVAEYKLAHRKETELVIAINGDSIQGVIHDLESTPAITTQVCAAIHLLSQSISYLSGKFKKVRVVCTVGNHERMMHKGNKGRQTREKWDSYSTIVHVALKHALVSHKNISFEIPIAPYAYVDILGHKYLITHTDTVLSVGYPGKTINVQNAKNKINDLKEGIGHIDVVVCGHVHVDTKQILPNGVTLLTNGSMSGIDEFALSIGITANIPTQQMFEITESNPVGDLRSVYLINADKEEALDSIVKPFFGKF